MYFAATWRYSVAETMSPISPIPYETILSV